MSLIRTKEFWNSRTTHHVNFKVPFAFLPTVKPLNSKQEIL